MPTCNPKQLGEPEVIREINPTVLFAFLQPFEGYLRSRGLVIKKESRIDNAAIEKDRYDAIVSGLAKLDNMAPDELQRLADSIFGYFVGITQGP
jgi:hypothetical protein